jgi:hypothetical protein
VPASARLTPEGRRILVERIASGRPAAHMAAENDRSVAALRKHRAAQVVERLAAGSACTTKVTSSDEKTANPFDPTGSRAVSVPD